MKANFTFYTLRLLNFSKIVFFLFLTIGGANAQKWSGVNGNEWLAGKYSQPWVKIGVTAKGIHKINVNDLPDAFKNANKDKIQMWYRGQQIAIIKADASEILFYGVPNDGASDALLYRFSTTRKNPYYSIYSDQSTYFLTVSSGDNGLRAAAPAVAANPGAVALTAQVQTDLKLYQNEHTHSTIPFYRPSALNSYFEEGKQTTGSSIMDEFVGTAIQTSNPKPVAYTNSYVPVPFSFQLKSPVGALAKKITIHIKSRTGTTIAGIYVGKTPGTLRSVGTLNVNELNDYDYTFNLEPTDFDASGNGTLGFKSTKIGSDGSGFSISYFTVEYEQAINMQGLTSYELTFPAVVAGSQSTLSIANAPAGTKVYNISNPSAPQIVSGTPSALVINRDDKALKLLAASTVTTVPTSKISTVKFTSLSPAANDYLIICSNSLNTSATDYAKYRSTTTPGRKFKPLVINIDDVYNQFNYGEPSPVAIRRFVDFMVSDGQLDKYLLLIGRSITYFERSIREIPDEVPTVGYPGSDLLLVDGLGGVQDDVPAIPVGRISATVNQQVYDYLEKVVTYESQLDVAWRKNVVHMNGGKTNNEITQFSNYLNGISNVVSSAPFSGAVLPRLKTVASNNVIEMTLAPELNGEVPGVEGVGMITYFGHGGVDKTDYNAGYVSNPSKGYKDTNKFPILFYNGCGVNNLFSGRNGEFGSLPTILVRPMSLDWLLAPNKGAVIVFGNTWDAYASTSNQYLDKLYEQIFSTADGTRPAIGNILKNVALQTKLEKNYSYNPAQNGRTMSYYDADRANVHQVILQGDPSLRVLITEGALPVNLISFNAHAEQDQVKVTWKTASESNNSHFLVERSYNGKNFESIGMVEGKGTTEVQSDYVFQDLKPLSGTSYYRLKQVDGDVTINGKLVKGKVTQSRLVSVSREVSKFLVISPNPVSDVAEIALDAPVAIKSWNLIDVKGRAIKSNQTGLKIDVSNLASGEYIVEILTENGDLYHKKVVKK
ncbi:putative type IX secretion system sortase PorU2 [Dyadobacter chenhuakuii]|uniref:C25 family cysteine peptidase n=1 Tax=Dyadobacter chenhuakuii TaxID=2909339 RepID=A0ABY4XF83_9BACT|nr:C25 family cysteine peptidase [Dyadobacter chenhuakuii]MCF2491753.1 C25 family cysteine peptidase [Dyadobacter chenhuakuii]USJ29083.1 C25 family cysteine peptidase [Dyadobacter chenhuakuii]